MLAPATRRSGFERHVAPLMKRLSPASGLPYVAVSWPKVDLARSVAVNQDAAAMAIAAEVEADEAHDFIPPFSWLIVIGQKPTRRV